MSTKRDTIFRVRFHDKDQSQAMEALVRCVEPSHLPGLITIRGFVFRDQTKKIVLPEEDAAAKRFRTTEALHIPYHHILFVEEVHDEPVDLKHLPFLRDLGKTDTLSPDA